MIGFYIRSTLGTVHTTQGTGTGNHCFLLYPSRSRPQSHAVCFNPLRLIHTISDENHIAESDTVICIEPYLCLFNHYVRKNENYVGVEEAYGLGSSQK